jgi:hypothetical protein
VTRNIAIAADLYDRAALAASTNHTSVGDFVSALLSEELASREFIESRARLFDREEFERALETVPDTEPEEHDRIG